jgi:FhuF-like iron-sulfur protein
MRSTTGLRLVTPAGADGIAESLVRAASRQVSVELRASVPDEESGWVNCAALLSDPAAVDRWRADLAGWLLATYGEAPDRVINGYLMSWYLHVPGYLAALLFHHERRVPSLRAEHLSFRMARPRPHPDAIAVHHERFVCLPDDPAAGTQNATVVADERALATVLRGRFTAHASRFVAAFEPTVRFGRRTLWAAATDALDGGLWLAGRYGGDEAAGVLDAALVLPAEQAPLTSASTLRAGRDEDGRTCWTRRRESCCFHYLLDRGQGECGTCPRVLPR